MAPLVLLILVLGVFPKPMLDDHRAGDQATMQHVGRHRPATPGQRGGRSLMSAP